MKRVDVVHTGTLNGLMICLLVSSGIRVSRTLFLSRCQLKYEKRFKDVGSAWIVPLNQPQKGFVKVFTPEIIALN